MHLQLQEEKLDIRESELRQLSAKLETTKGQLEALKKAKAEAEESCPIEKRLGSRSHESEKRQLQSDLKELEALYSQLELAKKAAERENQRLKIDLIEKDKEIQVSQLLYQYSIPIESTMIPTMTPKMIRPISHPSYPGGTWPWQ